MALIFAWVGALSKRGEIDGIDELSGFAKNLKRACIETIEGGVMTKDLAALAVPGSKVTVVNTLEFITEIKNRLDIKQ